MSNALVSSVVNALNFHSGEPGAAIHAGSRDRHPCEFSPREWDRSIGVLDRSGLTLPFYARMLAAGDSGRFLAHTVAALEQRRSDNQTCCRENRDGDHPVDVEQISEIQPI